MSRRLLATIFSMLVMPSYAVAKDLHVVAEANFASLVLNSPTPTVVFFWAEWCGPCRMIEPSLKQISDAMKAKVQIAKLNVDENPNVTQKYDIVALPTHILFEAGNVAARQVGPASTEKLQQWIEAHTAK